MTVVAVDVPAEAATFEVDPPYRLGATLSVLRHGGTDPTHKVIAGQGVWLTQTTPDGPVTVAVAQSAADQIQWRAWGPGAAWRTERAAALLGLDDPGYEAPPELAAYARAFRGTRLAAAGPTFALGVATILGQRISAVEAYRTWARLVRRHGTPAPGPAAGQLWVAPGPEVVGALSDHELHRLGVERKRIVALWGLARDADLVERAAARGPEHLEKRLRSIGGIGPWTAGWVRHAGLGDPDGIPIGDLHFPSVVAHTLAGERWADDARMLELLEPYRPHRARVLRWILVGGSRPAKRSPIKPNHGLLTGRA